MHMFFAILSFLVFGIVPPLAYGYSIQVTNDKDFTIMVVAAATFVCVGLLAIFKAYIDRCNGLSGYVKFIMYYLTTAVTASSVSYGAGTLVTRLNLCRSSIRLDPQILTWHSTKVRVYMISLLVYLILLFGCFLFKFLWVIEGEGYESYACCVLEVITIINILCD